MVFVGYQKEPVDIISTHVGFSIARPMKKAPRGMLRQANVGFSIARPMKQRGGGPGCEPQVLASGGVGMYINIGIMIG